MMQYHVSSKTAAYTSVSNEIPKHYQQHRLPGATYTECMQGPFGTVLRQMIENGEWIVQQAQFFISKMVRIYPVALEPLGVLHCMLSGSVPTVLSGFGEVLLRENAMQFFYVPAGKGNTALFSKGYYESFQIGLSADYLSNFSQNGSPLSEQLLQLQQAAHKGSNAGTCPLSLQALDQIGKIKHCELQGHRRKLYYQARINDLMLLYLHALDDSQQLAVVNGNRYEKEMRQLASYITENLENPLMIGQLAGKMGLQLQVMEKEFKKVHQQTIKSFIQDQRMKKACMLLADGKMTIIDVAYTVGYSDAAYFANTFKKQLGLTPTEYQKRAKNNTGKDLQ
ncbi:AraC-type DNA-binding protein [Chitinophaga rupis]|uniref:AraC-type DNA-binding protein n=1 Tax=Chitinophaga rupis TaxID=573321 RepID=A0A1H7HIH7_9BACT|nr:AraC family transcriptional regulator [Chitinophaga rupis]SEK49467.1 AraC-type DNA-binding protein [Chitinophaga rupis]